MEKEVAAEGTTEKKSERSMEIKKNGDGSMTVPLYYPIQDLEKNVVESITMKRVKVKHLKGVGEGFDIQMLLYIAGKVSGYEEKVMDEVDGADALRISKVVGDFLESIPGIGNKQ